MKRSILNSIIVICFFALLIVHYFYIKILVLSFSSLLLILCFIKSFKLLEQKNKKEDIWFIIDIIIVFILYTASLNIIIKAIIN